MRKLAILSAAFALVAVSFYGCDGTDPTGPQQTNSESATSSAETPLFVPRHLKLDEVNFVVLPSLTKVFAPGETKRSGVQCGDDRVILNGGIIISNSEIVVEYDAPYPLVTGPIAPAWQWVITNPTSTPQSVTYQGWVICI